jgi:hypothetical protein
MLAHPGGVDGSAKLAFGVQPDHLPQPADELLLWTLDQAGELGRRRATVLLSQTRSATTKARRLMMETHRLSAASVVQIGVPHVTDPAAAPSIRRSDLCDIRRTTPATSKRR